MSNQFSLTYIGSDWKDGKYIPQQLFMVIKGKKYKLTEKEHLTIGELYNSTLLF